MSDVSVAPAVDVSEVVAPEVDVTEAPTPEAKVEARKYKVKVDDAEREVDEAELLRGYSHAQSANQRFQEASKIRKQAETFIERLKSDPKSILTNPKLGIDFRKIAEEYVLEQMEAESLTPEERERKTEKGELEKYRSAEQQKKAEADAAQLEQVKNHYRQDYQKKFIGALETQGLPKTEFTVKRMAYYQEQAILREYELEPSALAELVREDYMKEFSALFGSYEDGEAMIKFLGEGNTNKIRKSDLARFKSQQGQPRQVSQPKHDASKPRQVMDRNALMKDLKKGW